MATKITPLTPISTNTRETKQTTVGKRLTDTDKWKKPFIKKLPAEYKLFWLYLLDDCDIAGIWHVDFEIAEIRLGIKLSEEKALGLFKERVVVFDNGTKWLMQDFVSFQYGNMTEKNKMFNPVMSILQKYKMGHISSINGGKDIYKEKDKDIIGGAGDFSPKGKAPDFTEVHALFVRNGKDEKEARRFYDYYDGLGWMKGVTPISNWGAFANMWIANPLPSRQGQPTHAKNDFDKEFEKAKHGN